MNKTVQSLQQRLKSSRIRSAVCEFRKLRRWASSFVEREGGLFASKSKRPVIRAGSTTLAAAMFTRWD